MLSRCFWRDTPECNTLMMADEGVNDLGSSIVGVIAVVDLQAVRATMFLFRALASALLAVDAAIL